MGETTQQQTIADSISNIAARVAALELGTGPYARYPLSWDSVGTMQILDAAVTNEKLAVNSITSDNITSGSITSDDIASGTITADDIQVGSLTADTLSVNSVDATKIVAGSITATEIQSGTITAVQISAGSITGDRISANTLTSAQIQAGAINADRLYSGTIQAQLIQSQNIAALSIGASHIQAGSITSDLIQAGTITAVQIAAGSITGDRVAAGTLTANLISSATILSSNIAAGTITATNIAAGTITGALLAASTITGDKIVTGAITADKISVANLQAVSAAMGTVTGGRFQTASSGTRAMMGSGLVTAQGTYTGIAGVDASNAVTFLFDAATGNVEVKGTIKSGSTGLGNFADQLPGASIVDNSITGPKLITDSITTRELAASSVTATELAVNAVVAGKILAGAINTADLAAGAVTADKITLFAAGQNFLADSIGNVQGAWTGNSGTTLTPTTGGPKGLGCMRLRRTGSAGVATMFEKAYGMTPGRPYIPSTYFFFSAAASRTVRIRVDWLTSADVLVRSDTVYTTATTQQNTWHRISAPTAVVAPANAQRAWVYFEVTSVFQNEDVFFAHLQHEEGEIVTEWKPYIDPTVIDGSTITSGLFQTSRANPRTVMDSSGLYATDSTGVKQFAADQSGLRILASDNNYAYFPTRSFSLDDSTSVERARLWGYRNTGSLENGWALDMISTAGEDNTLLLSTVQADNSAPTGHRARITLSHKNHLTQESWIIAEAAPSTGASQSRLVIGDAGKSSFIQYGQPAGSAGGILNERRVRMWGPYHAAFTSIAVGAQFGPTNDTAHNLALGEDGYDIIASVKDNSGGNQIVWSYVAHNNWVTFSGKNLNTVAANFTISYWIVKSDNPASS